MSSNINTVEKGVKKGLRPSFIIFPFPAGEGEKGDRASTTRQSGEANRVTTKYC
jgi:hypothetical protein